MLIGRSKPSVPKSFQNGRYLVRGLLGQGASGSVYEVLDQELSDESIALKVLHPHLLSDSSTLERFRIQVLLARQLSHPNIVQVHDFDRDEDGNHFITMELVDGVSLSTLLSDEKFAPLPMSEILEILSDTAAALAHAHGLGIVHRDLKPSNLIVSHDGIVKLSDFGLAKGLEFSFGLTQTGELLGSPAYTAPEQFRGEPIDARADVYSFGMLAYELIVGHPPFEGDSYLEQVEAHLTKDLPALAGTDGKEAPLWLVDFVTKCSAREAKRRYKDGTELRGILQEHLPETRKNSISPLRFTFLKLARSPKSQKRKRMLLLAATLAALIIVWVIAVQRNTRVFVGTWVMRAEQALGFELWPLKAPFLIHVSTLRPNDFFRDISHDDPTHSNVPAYLNAGGKIDMVDSAGDTLLHWATLNVESAYALDLIEHGLDANRQNNKGETPLLHAIRIRRSAAAYALLYAKANPNICDNSNVCPIHLAVENFESLLIYRLLNAGADIYLPNAEGRTVLHEIARKQKLETLNFLATQQPAQNWNFDARDPKGITPLMLAVATDENENRLAGVVDILLKRGARLDTRDNQCLTPLLHALVRANSHASKLLLDRGADPGVRDCQGKTAKEYAKETHLEALSPTWSAE